MASSTFHVDQTLLHIRSKDCVQLNSDVNTHLRIDLEESIRRLPDHNLFISLSSAEIPCTWYSISEYLKSNRIDVGQLAVLPGSSLLVPDGNYDIYELVDLITLDTSFPFSATFDENTSKVTLTNTDTVTHKLRFTDESTRELAKMLGFDRQDELVAAGQSTTSDGVVNLRAIHSIFLHTDIQTGNVFTSRSFNLTDIIDKIPVSSSFGDVILYDPYQTAPFRTKLNVNEVTNFAVQLKDQNDRLLNLNDARYELSLLFTQIPDVDKQTTVVTRRSVQSEVPTLGSSEFNLPVEANTNRRILRSDARRAVPKSMPADVPNTVPKPVPEPVPKPVPKPTLKRARMDQNEINDRIQDVNKAILLAQSLPLD